MLHSIIQILLPLCGILVRFEIAFVKIISISFKFKFLKNKTETEKTLRCFKWELIYKCFKLIKKQKIAVMSHLNLRE